MITESPSQLSRPRRNAAPFYITGGTLPVGAPSYIERDADAQLLAALLAGEFCYVLNTRQIGKSSLMTRTARELRAGGVAVAVIDLTAIGQNLSLNQWYSGLAALVGEQLDIEDEIEDYWDEHSRFGPMQRLLSSLRDVALTRLPAQQRLVVFIDEIDAIRSLPFATDELFAGIRECYNRRSQDAEMERLTFCLLGVATPAELIRDTRTTPFNIGARIDLTDFTDAEAMPLAQGIAGGKPVLERVLYWTSGHPYLTQRLLRAVADDPEHVGTARDVDALCTQLFLSKRARESEDNLLFIRERLLRFAVEGLDIAALLTLYRRILAQRPTVMDDPADPLASALKMAGVVKADPTGRLIVRNRIYARVFGRRWIDDNMPGAELRRQRSAFRRGVLRTAAIAAAIIIVIGTLAGVAVRERDDARAQSLKFEKLLYVSDMENASSAWDQSNLGRLRKLLQETRDNPDRGFEWGYWNRLAYPPGAVLRPGDGPLLYCDVSTDGHRLLTSGTDEMVRVWDAHTLRQLLSLHYPGWNPNQAFFTIDHKRIIVSDMRNGAACYDAASGKLLFSVQNHPISGNSPVFSYDGRIVVVNELGVGAVVYAVDTRHILFKVPCETAQCQTIFSLDSRLLYVSTMHPCVTAVYDIATGRRVCATQRPPGYPKVYCVGTFTSDNRYFATSSGFTFSLDVWNAANGKLVRHIRTLKQDESASFNYIGNEVVVLGPNALSAYSLPQGRLLFHQSLPIDANAENQILDFPYDGRFIVLATQQGAVYVFDARTGRRLTVVLGHTSSATCAQTTQDGRLLLTVSSDGTARLWDTAAANRPQMRFIAFPTGMRPTNVHLLDHMRQAVTYQASERMIRFWQVDDGKVTLKATAPVEFESEPTSDSPYFATFEPGYQACVVYSALTGRAVSPPGGLAFGVSVDVPKVSHDGRLLAGDNRKEELQIWDIEHRRILWQHSGTPSPCLAFSADDRTLAVGQGDGTLDLWNALSGIKTATLKGTTAEIQNIAFSPDGKLLCAGSQDALLRVWDVSSGRLLATMPNPSGSIESLRFFPDGRRIATASETGTVDIWNAQTGDLLLSLSNNGRSPQLDFSDGGQTLDVTNLDGGYINYWADFRDLSRDDSPSSMIAQ